MRRNKCFEKFKDVGSMTLELWKFAFQALGCRVVSYDSYARFVVNTLCFCASPAIFTGVAIISLVTVPATILFGVGAIFEGMWNAGANAFDKLFRSNRQRHNAPPVVIPSIPSNTPRSPNANRVVQKATQNAPLNHNQKSNNHNAYSANPAGKTNKVIPFQPILNAPADLVPAPSAPALEEGYLEDETMQSNESQPKRIAM